jgi:hypothetical protein
VARRRRILAAHGVAWQGVSVTADRPVSFGDYGVYIAGGSGNSVGGAPPPPPPGRGGWSRTGKIVVGVATVVSAILAAITLWVTWPEPTPGPTGGGATLAPAPTTTPRPDQPAAGRPAVYDGTLTLTRHRGFDLDEGRAAQQTGSDSATDLYLGDYLGIRAGGGVYLDTFGAKSGAYDRCRALREAGATPLPQAIGTGLTQYCFTSSAGRPGWLRVVRLQSADSVLVEVTVWAG